MGPYTEVFRRSIQDPEGFWGGAVQGIDWYRKPTVVLDRSSPPFYRWFSGGVLNTCFNAVDRHVGDGRGERAALIYDSPVTGVCQTLTYRQLLRLHVVDPATGADVPPGTTGDIVVRLPLPPGCLPTLWGDDQRFTDSYLVQYPGAYLT